MYKWEYQVVFSVTSIPVAKLNELGAEGWEHYFSSGNANYFKRHIKPKEERTQNAAKGKR